MVKTWPKTLTGKLCFFHDSIQSMRRAGYVWEQIKDALIDAGVCCQGTGAGQIRSAWLKTRKGIESGRLVAGDCVLEAQKQNTKVQQKPAQTDAVANTRPLPELKKMGQDPYEERLAKLRAANIDTSSFEKE